MLMKAKANLLATDHATGEMPLHFSAKGQMQEDNVRSCVPHQVVRSVTYLCGIETFSFACVSLNKNYASAWFLTEGKEETMRLILDSKIDVDQRGNRKKRTALMLASVHGHTHIQETLLEEYHADVNLRSVFTFFC